MSIQIIDGFQVNTASPIDNRIVASGSAARNAIPYKYEGLRIFDTSDSIPYVWLNGTWVSENASGVIGSGTTTNYIPKLTGTNIIGNSVIYQSGSNIGVNTLSPSATFSVNGSLSATSLIGDGSALNTPGNTVGVFVNAGNITTGNLSLSRLTNGPTNWVLMGSNLGSPTYSNPSQMTVGTASVALVANTATTAATSITASNVYVSTGSTGVNYIPFTSASTTSGPLKTNSSITYDAANSILNLSKGIKYLGNSGNYTLVSRGDLSTSYFGGGTHSIDLAVVGSILGYSTLLVEATFVSRLIYDDLIGHAGRVYSTNKIISIIEVGSSGTFTPSSTTVTGGTVNTSNSSGTISAGTVVQYASNTLSFRQVIWSQYSHSVNLQVFYKITSVTQ